MSIGSATTGAGQPPSTFEYQPQSGPPGTQLDVSGTCLPNGQPTERADIYLARIAEEPGSGFDHTETYPVGPDGSWAGIFPVPSDAPAGDYVISLSCASGDAVHAITVIDEDFTVTPGEAPTTTTTTVPPTPQPTPVVEEPTFTG